MLWRKIRSLLHKLFFIILMTTSIFLYFYQHYVQSNLSFFGVLMLYTVHCCFSFIQILNQTFNPIYINTHLTYNTVCIPVTGNKLLCLNQSLQISKNAFTIYLEFLFYQKYLFSLDIWRWSPCAFWPRQSSHTKLSRHAAAQSINQCEIWLIDSIIVADPWQFDIVP